MAKQRLLLKMSGQILGHDQHKQSIATMVVDQIVHLHAACHLAIVMGGGNLFRGDQHGVVWGISDATAHTMGMLATVMNSIALQDLIHQRGVACTVFSALETATCASTSRNDLLKNAIRDHQIVIFAGGTGAPFVTTDTAAVIRALQYDADAVWKCTNVDGIFDQDPSMAGATLLHETTHDEVLARGLGLMDQTAHTLARTHQMPVRILNIFKPNNLVDAFNDPSIGSFIR